ncbi:MAG: 50S ribosomal protein L29 [Patescibacteria group bacterium]|jgi:ribosomal protein L29
MKYKELKSKPETELQKLLTDSREKLRELKFKVASNQLKNVREIRSLRKTIAQLLFALKGNKSLTKTK